MKSGIAIKRLLLSFFLGLSLHGLANNIVVSNISLTNRNTSTQTVRVQFTLSWDNSWRTTSAPFNWDAAWVFVKFKVGANGVWKHATLATSGHTLPGIAAATQTDANGIFIYRSAAGGPSTFNPTGIQLQWNYGSDDVSNEAQIFVRVFAIEMVYNQVGGFQAGSGAISNGEFRRANDITSSGTASTFTITGSLPTLQGNSSSSSPTNIAAYNNTSTDLTGTNTATLAAGYPTGFNAFYSMKYEISQQQYVDFLNTLTYTQQAARTDASSPPNSTAGTGALISGNLNRNGIDIQTPGTASTVPAVYACNLDGDASYNEADDGQHIACNYLSWSDVTAFLDWAALRPMTELEFEKSCRGIQSPVASEYPWGSTSATALSGISNAALTDEIASNTSSNIAFNNSFTSGPVRSGIFATGTNSRSSSGAGYYGNMDLGGNLWERIVTLGNSTARTYSGNHGNGTLTSDGNADVTGWPAAAGNGWKGGSWLNTTTNSATTSDRAQAANTDNTRSADAGGRGVRTISAGIVTDGLVLWLDAGITSSYPESGTTWTDLSGNRNNGTMFGSVPYGSDIAQCFDFATVTGNALNASLGFTFGSNMFPNTGNFTISVWVKNPNNNSGQVSLFSNATGGDGYRFGVSTNFIYYLIGPSYQEGVLSFLSILNTTSWYNVSVVFNRSGTSILLYLNGVLQNSVGIPSQSASSNNVPGIVRGGCCNPYTGKLSIVFGYNRVLSATELLQNFNAQKARFGL